MSNIDKINSVIDSLMSWDKMKEAFDFIEKDAPYTTQEQIEICQVPSPTFEEAERGRLYASKFEALGLRDVHTDDVGNVFGTVRGTSGGPRLIVAAHLDTVFPMDTDVTVKVDGTVLRAPGIGDDTRGLAEILSVVRAINISNMRPVGDIIFCGNVCEEGQGDLRGVRHIFETLDNIGGFLTIDGDGPQSVLYTATGSHRYKITFCGKGGHSLHGFGMPNPVHALGRAIGYISDIEVPKDPVTTFSIGVVSGGTSINSIAYEASMLIDMRSNSAEELKKLEDKVLNFADMAVTAENNRWQSSEKVTVHKEMIGNRPAGQLKDDSPIVLAACEAIKRMGLEPEIETVGSTDANVPISLGVPALNIGSGGEGGNTHNLQEWYDVQGAHTGPQKTLLLIMSLVGAEGVCQPVL